jgi:hypothetical protein
MRTTLDIDEDVLNATKEIARQESLSAGQVVSRLLRGTLTGQYGGVATGAATVPALPVAGFRPFQLPGASGKIVTNDQINALRETEGI